MTSEKPNNRGTKSEWLSELAQAVRLREGVEGVIRALWALHSGKIYSTRDWSATIQIPVPVLAALRRELEKRNILIQDKKLRVSESGVQKLQTLFGQQIHVDQICSSCRGSGRIFPPEAMPLLEKFQAICEQRPEVDVTLDQSHATPETGIRKALFLLEKGLLQRSIFLMGDDDFISLACLLVRETFLSSTESFSPIVVMDIDSRYLDLIRELSEGKIQVREYDAREDFPVEMQGNFASAFTDPAYTENGITTFSYRCHEALEDGGTLFLSMPFPDGSMLNPIQKNLLEMGFVIREIHPGFNRYHGASMHASRTNLIIGEKIGLTPEKKIRLRYTPFYTGEVRIPGAVYACTICETPHRVGPGNKYLTIKDLKQSGCEECGNDLFRRFNTREIEQMDDFSHSE